VAKSEAALDLGVIRGAFKGNTVATNLLKAINTRLKIDTMVDTSLKYAPTLHAAVARGS